MITMDLTPMLRKSLKKQYCLRLETSHPDKYSYDGIVSHIRPDYIVIHNECNFEFDGLVVIRRKSITKCSDRTYDTHNKVLLHSGQLGKLKTPTWLDDCSTFQDIFAQLKRRRIWPAVEMVEKKDSWFLIGPITHVEEKGSDIRCYDGQGKWEDVYPINYRYLHNITFGDSYSKHFNNYMRSKGK